MTATSSSLDLEDAARLAAGNWRKFESFVWRAPDLADADDWAIL